MILIIQHLRVLRLKRSFQSNFSLQPWEGSKLKSHLLPPAPWKAQTCRIRPQVPEVASPIRYIMSSLVMFRVS